MVHVHQLLLEFRIIEDAPHADRFLVQIHIFLLLAFLLTAVGLAIRRRAGLLFDKLDSLEWHGGITYFNGIQLYANSEPAISSVAGTFTGFAPGPERIVLLYHYFQGDVGTLTNLWSIDTKQARVMVMLHELKHLMTKVPHRRGDVDGPDSDNGWNQAILQKCLGLTRAIPKH